MGEGNNFNVFNVDLKSISDLGNNIIDKFSQAVGWISVPKGAKKDMDKAVETYIDEIQKDPLLPPFVKAMKIATVRKEIKEYVNVQDILQHAQEFGQSYMGSNESLDEDWTMYFYDMAKKVSLEDAKVIWGKLLAEECDKNGSVPKQLLHTLSVMGKKDADAFNSICSFIAKRIFSDGLGAGNVIIGSEKFGQLLEQQGLDYLTLNNLQSLGLLKVNVFDDRLILDDDDIEEKHLGFEYHGIVIKISNLKEEVPIGYVSLTGIGLVLANLIDRQPIDGFLECIKNYYEDKEFKVSFCEARYE